MGDLWTGDHQVMDQLVALGIASDTMAYLMPRELWKITGGMPYLLIK